MCSNRPGRGRATGRSDRRLISLGCSGGTLIGTTRNPTNGNQKIKKKLNDTSSRVVRVGWVSRDVTLGSKVDTHYESINRGFGKQKGGCVENLQPLTGQEEGDVGGGVAEAGTSKIPRRLGPW